MEVFNFLANVRAHPRARRTPHRNNKLTARWVTRLVRLDSLLRGNLVVIENHLLQILETVSLVNLRTIKPSRVCKELQKVIRKKVKRDYQITGFT